MPTPHGPSILPRLRGFAAALLAAALLSAAFSVRAAVPEFTDTGYRWPTDVTRLVTSSFAEPRPDRFHAGMDFSTNASSGYNCYAIEDGYVVRVKTDFQGYGKVVYLKLPDGKIAVYAHLSGFEERIAERVRNEQLKRGRYEVELVFSPDELSYRKGDLIAYTGDTGAGPPHLHFELRDGIGTPMNPSLHGFVVQDSRPPVIRRLAIRPLDGRSEVQGDMLPVIRRVRGGRAPSVRVYGRVGISAEIVDYQDGGWHRLGPRVIELFVNGELRHRTTYNQFPYRVNKHARLDFDFELQRQGYRRFRRLYVLPGNDLPYYDDSLPGGMLDTGELPPGRVEIGIHAVDNAGNERWVLWDLEVMEEPTLPPAAGQGPPRLRVGETTEDEGLDLDVSLLGTVARLEVSGVPEGATQVQVRGEAFARPHQLVPRGRGIWVGRGDIPLSFRGPCTFVAEVAGVDGGLRTRSRQMRIAGFQAGTSDRWTIPEDGFELRVPGSALWFDMAVSMTTRPRRPETIAPSYVVRPFDHPFRGLFTVAFHAQDEPWHPKAVVVYRERSKGGRWTAMGHDREMNGFVLKALAFSLETFSVMVDTVAPRMHRPSLSDGASIRNARPWLAVQVEDELAGLDLNRCRLEVDGETVIWVYDPDRNTISYRPWSELPSGHHTWSVVAVDEVGNETRMEHSFRVR